tara:strand:- start:323 stop:736 length:414 start_codon:yes stop_codon:yes gene_type:complete
MNKKILIILLSLSGSLYAGCIEDFGTPKMFGSYDQLKHIQKEIKKNNCDFVQIEWNIKTFQGDIAKKMIALDVEEGMMIRAMRNPYGNPSWEFWYGFNRASVLNDDPSDGFDLPNYTTSFDNSKLSKELRRAFKSFK